MASSKKKGPAAQHSDDEDFAGVDIIDTDVQLTSSDDLVGLIDQPAWKTILISLVKNEKMDPWNIDVKDLAKKYLEKIRALQNTDLRLPANAILASAILVKFKARTLRFPSIEEADEVEWKSLLTEEQLLGGIMPELLSPGLSREGKVTLDQLVESIEAIMERTKSKVQKERDRSDRPAFALPFGSMNLESKMQEMLNMSLEYMDETGLARFSSMMHAKPPTEIIEFFLSLLFLVNERKLNAWQETLFGEIFISKPGSEPLETDDKAETESNESGTHSNVHDSGNDFSEEEKS
mgnify:CR=1 FL=1